MTLNKSPASFEGIEPVYTDEEMTKMKEKHSDLFTEKENPPLREETWLVKSMATHAIQTELDERGRLKAVAKGMRDRMEAPKEYDRNFEKMLDAEMDRFLNRATMESESNLSKSVGDLPLQENSAE